MDERMRDDAHTDAIPHLDRLPEAGVEAVHEASMHVLEEIGVQFAHDRAVDEFAAAGAEVDRDDRLVYLPRDLVEDCIDSVPATFTLHARNPDNDVTVGDGDPVRAPGYGPPNVRTFEGGRRRATVEDYETLVTLCQQVGPIDCTGYKVCDPRDVDPAVEHCELIARSLRLSDMPVMGSAYGADRARESLEMVGIATDDPDLSVPYAGALVNTVSPRRFDTEMLGGLLEYAERGQPVLVSSFTMAGASGPATLAGAMAQANAENLAGIALTQLVNEGTPAVYGLPASNIDARYGSLSTGSPESALFASFAGQMGRYYDVPSRAGGSLSDAKLVDYQAGAESAMVGAVTRFADVGFVLHAAGILESYSSISPEKFVLDCELLQQFDRYAGGFPLSEESFALDTVADVDPAGHFLDRRHTVEHSREGCFHPELFDRRSHGDWHEDGRKSSFERAHDRVGRLLADYERPPLDADVERELREYVETARERAG
ncbi:trimethylamine--corrinoid methyltransferase [Halobacteriales archaeon QS_1_68_17]|nr:MAG: trimethylamine--corrinoid methyltransferase [Halobacteriales archaeon QS_1_68_17]